jgi:hypothetical protein
MKRDQHTKSSNQRAVMILREASSRVVSLFKCVCVCVLLCRLNERTLRRVVVPEPSSHTTWMTWMGERAKWLVVRRLG